MATWKESPNWTPFDEINGGQQFTNALTPEDLNSLAENIAYLYAHQGENEYLGEYAGGNYRAGAIVKYSDGNIYMCIKDTDDEQEPTNATYWQMLNTASGGGEVIPEYTEVEDFVVFASAADEGSLELGYSVSQDVKLSAPSGGASAVQFDSLEDDNFVPWNIKSGVSIFGMTGDYEGSPLPTEVSTEAEMTALLTSGEVGGIYKYTGTTGTYENGALYVLESDLITFTINGTKYQAESGMTWGEWCESDYNTGTFTKQSTYIADDAITSEDMVSTDGTFTGKVAPTDTIIADHSYSVYEQDHGGGSGN